MQKNILAKVQPLLSNEVIKATFGGDAATAALEPDNFKKRVHEQWQAFFGLFLRIVGAPTEIRKDEAVDIFHEEYSSEVWGAVMGYSCQTHLQNESERRSWGLSIPGILGYVF